MPNKNQKQTDSEKVEAGSNLTRSLSFDASITEAIDVAARTVEVAFSSETPVSRWGDDEILDHASSSVRLNRINDGGPLLLDHYGRQIGVIEKAWIDKDLVGRALVRFSKSIAADEIFQDVIDGIRRHISVRYTVHKVRFDESDEGRDTYRVMDWEPIELSFVSIPADHSVGVGRSMAEFVKPENIPAEPVTEKVAVVAEDLTLERDIDMSGKAKPEEKNTAIDSEKVQKEERARSIKLLEMGRKHGLSEEAESAVEEGITVDQFRSQILETVTSDEYRNDQERNAPATFLGLTDQEAQNFSLLRALNAQERGDWSKAGFEQECSREISDRLGKESRGFFLPYDIQIARTMTIGGTPNQGSDLLGVDHRGESWIDVLRDNCVLSGLGAQVLDGLVGDVDIPIMDSDGTFKFYSEDSDVEDSEMATRSIELKNRMIAGAIPVSRKLLKQSSPSVEALLRRGMAEGCGLALDNFGFHGNGIDNTPIGIINRVGINVVDCQDLFFPMWEEVVAMETAVSTANALDGYLHYVATSMMVGALKTAPKDKGSGTFLANNGEVNGYKLTKKNGLVPDNVVGKRRSQLLFGNFRDVYIGMWGVLDIVADKATKAKSGGLVMRVFQDADINIGHAQSFAKLKKKE